MAFISQADVDRLISCPKEVTDPPAKNLRLSGAHWRNDAKLSSAEIAGVFSMFMRKNEDFQRTFQSGSSTTLTTDLGRSHCRAVMASMESSTAVQIRHIRIGIITSTAQLRAMAAGLAPEKYAEKTAEFASYEQALQYFVVAVNLNPRDADRYFPSRMQNDLLRIEGEMDILEILKSEFNHHIAFREKRPGIVQIVAPLFHEDGDMVDIFLDLPKTPSTPLRISDHGLTLMRLSYSYEVDTPTKRRALDRILSENGVAESQGRLYIETTPEGVYPALLQFAQTIAKVSNMQMFKREVVQNLFYETLNEFVATTLSSYRPEAHYTPIPDRDDLDVDWRFPMNGRDIYLFGVRDTAKARLVGLTCLEYQSAALPFRSVIIHEDLENGLSKKDQRRITNIADKQFATFPDFMSDAEKYFAREVQADVVQ